LGSVYCVVGDRQFATLTTAVDVTVETGGEDAVLGVLEVLETLEPLK